MRIATTYYGNNKSYLPMLLMWWDFYQRSGCKLPVVILSDYVTEIPEPLASECEVKRYDPNAMPAIVREGKVFDVKGSIMCQALPRLGTVFIIDTDALLMKDPTEALHALPKLTRMAMGQDAGVRHIPTGDMSPPVVEERNAGVMFFGDPDYTNRMNLVYRYVQTYKELSRNPEMTGVLLEQRTWSLMFARLQRKGEAVLLPRELNWAHLWGREEPGTIVLHEHGPSKWKRLNIPDVNTRPLYNGL